MFANEIKHQNPETESKLKGCVSGSFGGINISPRKFSNMCFHKKVIFGFNCDHDKRRCMHICLHEYYIRVLYI